MKALTFLVRLIEPVLATQPVSGEPNSATAYTFIPGSMLRGAVIARYGGQVDASLPDIQHLFFDGSVRYLNAYPAYPTNNARMLPRPLSWFVPKDQAGRADAPIYDFAVQRQQWSDPAKPPKGDFGWLDAGTVCLDTPTMQVTVHNASRERNWKSEDASQVYRYEAIAAGQVFAGAIVAEDENWLTTLEPVLGTREFVLGGSHTGGYGRVEITDVELDSNWQEYPPDESNGTGDRAILTCLSDVIWRGADGQVNGMLNELVGAEPLDTFRRMRLAGGFNREWGLPLPQAWAIEAGSVFVFSSEQRTALEKLVENGIGERRAEGLGRIAVNWHTRPQLAQDEMPRRARPPLKNTTLAGKNLELAQRMAGRRLQIQVERALAVEINRLAGGGEAFKKLPGPAQLSRARLAARQAWLTGDLSVITRHFQDLSDLTRHNWDGARLGDELLIKWIDRQIQNKESFRLVPGTVSVAGAEADWDKLRDKTLARLIEGVLKQAVKEAKRQAERGSA